MKVTADSVSVRCTERGIAVAGTLTIATAPRALEAARDCFEQGNGVLQVDLGDLQHTDSAALAVLLEWHRVAARKGRSLEFVAVPERLLQLAQISELEEVVGFRHGV